jgi:hypothetical protein
MATNIYRKLKLRLACDVGARLDHATLSRVFPPGITIHADLITATNCCWVNVWITTLAAMGVCLSDTEAAYLKRRITAASSRMMSPLDIGDLVTSVNLPVTLVEYSQRDQVGWSIGTSNGPIVALVNTGAHYQIWLPVGSDLAQRFAAPVAPTHPWSTVAKGKPLSAAARRRVEAKNLAKATAGARKRQHTAGACKVKAVPTTTPMLESKVAFDTPMPNPVRQPGVSQWWGRGGELEVTNPTPTNTFAQATSDSMSVALQFAAEDRVNIDSIEDETRRLKKIYLDEANQIDADARMARELYGKLNGC